MKITPEEIEKEVLIDAQQSILVLRKLIDELESMYSGSDRIERTKALITINAMQACIGDNLSKYIDDTILRAEAHQEAMKNSH
jgi:hypothetical protein